VNVLGLSNEKTGGRVKMLFSLLYCDDEEEEEEEECHR
jgi:hypothetical protein